MYWARVAPAITAVLPLSLNQNSGEFLTGSLRREPWPELMSRQSDRSTNPRDHDGPG